MNPELWHNISTVFMTAGIIFLIFTVWLSAKLNFVSIIQSEINNRKERKNSDENDYFIRNENQNPDNSAEITDNSLIDNDIVSFKAKPEESVVNHTVLAERPEEPVASHTVLAERPEEPVASHTVLAERPEEPITSNTILISSENTIMYESNNEENGDFIISENIIVIHGDPSSIRRKVAL